MNISLIRKGKAESRSPFKNSTPYDKRCGFWGVVREVHPEDCTVHVLTDMGILLTGVRVACAEWVTVKEGKRLTGERHLPPIDTYVFCMMPTGEYTSAFVLCSGFTRQEAVHADFKKKGEDAAMTHERIENSGWHTTTDYRSGTKKVKNKTDSDPTIVLEIDQEDEGNEKVTLTIHGTIVNLDKDGGVSIETDKSIVCKDKKGFIYETERDASIQAADTVTIKSKKAGMVEVGNSISTLGAMIESLLDYLVQLKTVGSPASHTAAPDFIANIQALKVKWKQVFT